jgi:hypothetical protein
MRSITRTAIYGAMGGLYGAAAMTVLRLAARRGGLVEKMVPQAMGEWLSHRLGVEPPGGATGHHVLDQSLHLGYGMAWGAAYGLARMGSRQRATLWRGGAFGGAIWALGLAGLLPLLRVARPAWRSTAAENVVNIGAHLAFGLAVQLLSEELAEQDDRRATTDAERFATRIG